jgi:hypothetical protein
MRCSRFGERECLVDLDAQLAAHDPLEQVGDHRVDAGVLGQQRPAEEDAAQGVVLPPEIPRLDEVLTGVVDPMVEPELL